MHAGTSVYVDTACMSMHLRTMALLLCCRRTLTGSVCLLHRTMENWIRMKYERKSFVPKGYPEPWQAVEEGEDWSGLTSHIGEAVSAVLHAGKEKEPPPPPRRSSLAGLACPVSTLVLGHSRGVSSARCQRSACTRRAVFKGLCEPGADRYAPGAAVFRETIAESYWVSVLMYVTLRVVSVPPSFCSVLCSLFAGEDPRVRCFPSANGAETKTTSSETSAGAEHKRSKTS